MDKAELTEKWNKVCYFLHQSISPNYTILKSLKYYKLGGIEMNYPSTY
jgi:hypothetical protein